MKKTLTTFVLVFLSYSVHAMSFNGIVDLTCKGNSDVFHMRFISNGKKTVVTINYVFPYEGPSLNVRLIGPPDGHYTQAIPEIRTDSNPKKDQNFYSQFSDFTNNLKVTFEGPISKNIPPINKAEINASLKLFGKSSDLNCKGILNWVELGQPIPEDTCTIF